MATADTGEARTRVKGRRMVHNLGDQQGHVLPSTQEGTGIYVSKDGGYGSRCVRRNVSLCCCPHSCGTAKRKSRYWASVLNGLRNRGVEDIFIACTDNLTGFSAAIEAVYPQTEIQNCIIHQLRNSSKYVSYKDIKALMADLKAIYAAVDEQSALDALDAFAEIWDKKYPKISKSWRENWANLSTYFKYPKEVRRLIYTTNTIEGFNRQLRKVTKSKAVFPTDDSLFKMLYLAMMERLRRP